MKRDGTFCKIEDLKTYDAMMPFYRRDLFNGCKEEGKGYRWIYTMDRRSKMSGWTTEHRLLAEMIKGSQLDDNEVVHHLNFNKHDNRIENLQIMLDADHKRLHTEIINGKKWSDENASWIEEFKLKSSPTKDKNLIYALPKASSVGDYENPYLKLQKLVKIQNLNKEFHQIIVPSAFLLLD
jgi:hypothetical protein